MPQVFFALQCFQCSTFQVVQKTQQQKFTCKLCGAKQSIVRVFASGAAKECRAVVQQARAEASPENVLQLQERELTYFCACSFFRLARSTG